MPDWKLPNWMLEAPPFELSADMESAFEAALEARNPALLPSTVPRWIFLQWAASRGYLLHGSKRDDIAVFEPRTPIDLSLDEFSKRTGVFAASDGLWAMIYALRDKGLVKRTLNMAQQVRQAGAWSPMQYFLSFGPKDSAQTDGRALMTAGFVYLLSGQGFEQAPVVEWPNLGSCLEAHWFSARPVIPLMCVPVVPDDFPLPIRVHDADRADALAASDPWGFPWVID